MLKCGVTKSGKLWVGKVYVLCVLALKTQYYFHLRKKEPNSCLNDSTEDRFRAVEEFIKGESFSCKMSGKTSFLKCDLKKKNY